jgi:hypothetical protein
LLPAVGSEEVDLRTHRHQAGWVDGAVALVVMPLEAIDVHGLRHPWHLEEIAAVGKEVG